MGATTTLRLEVLHVADCPNLAPLLARLRDVTDSPVTTREITTDADAAALGMAGSPTLLVNGVDPFRAPDDCACGVACRLYRDDDGRLVPVPSTEQLRQALRDALPSGPADSVDALAAARARAVPQDPAQRAVHQAILRHFAAGRPTTPAGLDAITADPARTTGGRTHWEPADAVVFAGIDTCGGAAADCCCDYLNFFTDRAAARTWADHHPEIPGEILGQDQAQQLADRIFESLLS